MSGFTDIDEPMARWLLQAVLVTGPGAVRAGSRGRKTVRAKVSGTGAVSATVQIYGSTENSTANGVLLATLSPSGTTSASDGVAFDAPWPYMWANCTAITGTGATLDVAMGV